MWEQWDTVVFPKEFRHGVRDVQSGYEIVSLFQAVSEGSENTDRQIENRELILPTVNTENGLLSSLGKKIVSRT